MNDDHDIHFICVTLAWIQLDSQLNWDFMGIAKAIKDIFGAIKIIVDPYKLNFPGGGLTFCNVYWNSWENPNCLEETSLGEKVNTSENSSLNSEPFQKQK